MIVKFANPIKVLVAWRLTETSDSCQVRVYARFFFLVANAYAKDVETMATAKMGPVSFGNISELVNVS